MDAVRSPQSYQADSRGYTKVNEIVKNLNGMFKERIRLGLTRKDVATSAQVSERAIRSYEEGRSYPTKEIYNRLANVFMWEVWP